MKKAILSLVIVGSISLFQFCSSGKKMAGEAKEPTREMAKMMYATDVKPLLAAKCTPCHFPPEGRKKPLNTYASVKETIDDIIVRTEKNPEERGFMPMRHPKLSDSVIHVFKQWKQDGLAD